MDGPLGYLRASKKWRNAKKASSMTAQQTQKALGFRIAVPPPPLPPHQPLATIPPPLSSSAGPALTQMSNLLRNELLAFTFEHFSLVAVLSGRIALSEAAQLARDRRRVNSFLFLANCFVLLSIVAHNHNVLHKYSTTTTYVSQVFKRKKQQAKLIFRKPWKYSSITSFD